MANYPNSLKLEVRLKANNLYELCQLCLPIINEVGLPTIKKWKIPSDDDPKSEGLEERLIELRKQIETAYQYEDEEIPYLSKFILEEGTKYRGDNMVLRLCYYDDRESYCAGHCGLHLYIKKHHTIEDIQKFVDCAVNFARKLIERASISYLDLDRGNSGLYIPDAPLLPTSSLMIFVIRDRVKNVYDNPELFWNSDWYIKEQYGDRFLLARCLDMQKYLNDYDYCSQIISSHWDLVRAAKPGTIEFFCPIAESDELNILNAGKPRLSSVGYSEQLRRLEYTCWLEEGEHIQGWEILKIWEMLDDGRLKDGRELKDIKVVFADKKTAEQEKRPLLEAGAKVIYMNEKGQDIEIKE